MANNTNLDSVPIKKEYVRIQPRFHPLRPKPDNRKVHGLRQLNIAQKKPGEKETPEEKILALVRRSLQPFSDRLDPFAALPVNLDRFQEHLVSFYLIYYPRVTYGFSPRLRPHPVASN